MTLLLATEGGMKASTRAWVGYSNILACWTMFPLLVRDGLTIPYFVLTGLWSYLMGLPPTSLSVFLTRTDGGGLALPSKIVHFGTYVGMIGWHVVQAFVLPPEDKPDLWVVANVCLGCAGFSICYLWCLWRTIELSGLLTDLGLAKRSGSEKKIQ